MALNDKELRFIEEYLIDLNATQSWIRTGYKQSKHTHTNAAKKLNKPEVAKKIAEAMAERSRRTGVNADRVLEELAKIAFVNPIDVIDFDDASLQNANREDTAAISSVKVKKIPTQEGEGVEREIRMHDKIKALELTGKHLGMFTDKLDINHESGVVIINDIPRTNEDKTD